jgi:hypothetical protein
LIEIHSFFLKTSAFSHLERTRRQEDTLIQTPGMATSIQDRTIEFRSILGQAQKRLAPSKVGVQRQALLSDTQRAQANGSPDGIGSGANRARSEFARRAAEIGRGITATTAKLQRLAECMFSGGLQTDAG